MTGIETISEQLLRLFKELAMFACCRAARDVHVLTLGLDEQRHLYGMPHEQHPRSQVWVTIR